eukprot:TRINITY_DN13748_c0_g1_i10.p2 TRINITY_DN13748_c0_g1~~TRINITY_DN13748_c0_g1_i10.p2  ORF type:complete len:132 (+),score=41.65 TRINITY_DN13748_c0_g1_i10:608-1003(+)
MRGRNNGRLALALYTKASSHFCLWRMRTSQCNLLTANSCHLNFKLLESNCDYFKFLERQELYGDRMGEVLCTQRFSGESCGEVGLSLVKEVSKRIGVKKVFWAWRAKVHKRKMRVGTVSYTHLTLPTICSV